MGSTSQQLSQLVDSESLSPYMAYLCLCDTMFWGLATRLCTCVFSKHICFFHLRIFTLLLSELCSLFSMSKRIGLRKLFAKLRCYRALCSFLRGQVVNYSQRF
jgi:hypothetical protein